MKKEKWEHWEFQDLRGSSGLPRNLELLNLGQQAVLVSDEKCDI
jgi:hypothetical protein